LKKNSNIEVENFGQSGSSVYYSYNLYLKHKDKFDKIIFSVTTPTRITVNHPSQKGKKLFLTSWDTILDKQRDYMRQAGIYDAVNLFYQYLYDLEEYTTYRDLIIQDLKSYKNCLIMDIADLMKVSKIDYEFYLKLNYNYYDMHKFLDNRYCHMNNENNSILADMILSWISSGVFEFNLSKFVNPRVEDREIYFVSR
jgi:hypothetical protein